MKIELDKAIFIVSLDTELAWGTRGDSNYFNDYENSRKAIVRLLDLLEKYSIKATWAVVGHLFLDHCEKVNGRVHPEIIRDKEHDFLSRIDPCNDRQQSPHWYGADIVSRIMDCSCHQEIGCHTFSHPVIGVDANEDYFDSELKRCRQLADEKNIDLKSFVYPKNNVAYLPVLKANGFSCYRARELVWYNYLPAKLRKVGHLVDEYFLFPAAVGLPSYEDGLWQIPGSYFYPHRRGWARPLPINFRVIKAKWGIKKAVQKRKVFHLWFHPFNLASDPDNLLSGLEKIFAFVGGQRDLGRLENLTMSEAADLLNSRYL